MFKLKISKKGIRLAAEREKGCDIQAGTDQDIDRSIKFWEKKNKKPAPYKGLKCV